MLQSLLESGYTLSPYNKDNQYLKATKRRIGYPADTGKKYFSYIIKHSNSEILNDSCKTKNNCVGSETWTWEHFPLAIEGPPELWRTLARYSDEKAFEASDE